MADDPPSDAKPILMFGTPVYGGLSPKYVLSLIETRAKLRDLGILSIIQFLPGIALVSYARNELVSAFRASKATLLLMIDADIAWTVETVLRLIERSKTSDFVGGAPPHRRLNVDMVVKAVQSGKKNPGRFARDYAVRLTDDDRARGRTRADNGFIEVGAVGSAFLMLTRNVFDRLADANPQLRYTSPEGTEAYAFFDPYVLNGKSLGEDGAFCQRWKDIGGKIELLLEAPFVHEGPVAVAGSLHEIIYD
jgi:hypothetical protein